MARKSRKQADTTPAVINKPINRAGAYVRLSVEDKKHKGDSIEIQQTIINAYISENPTLELIEVYIDNGLSGQSFDRPAFNRMIADMESGKINCCITKDLSRLGRNAIDTGFYVEKFFPTKGIRFIAITDDYDSANPNSGGVMVSLKNMVNEAYALEVGRKVRQTKQMQISKGLFVGRLAPYGYVKSSEDKYKLVADPYAANIVKQIFDKAIEGESVTEITDWLNTNGILPPMRYFHTIGLASEKEASGHVHWNMNVLYAILKNQIYCGDMVQGKGKTRSFVKKVVPKGDWVITPDTHEAIVNREIFNAAQSLAIKSHSQGKSNPRPENIFKRKIFCGYCGYSLKRGRSRQNSFMFACATGRIYAKNDCFPVSIQENMVKDILLEILKKQVEVFSNNKSHSKHHIERNKQQTELHKIQGEINKVTHLLKSLYESLVTQLITLDEYKELKMGYEAKMDGLSAKEKELRSTMIEYDVNASIMSKASLCIGGISEINDFTPDMVDRLIDKILVFNDNRIEIQFKYSTGLPSEKVYSNMEMGDGCVVI